MQQFPPVIFLMGPTASGKTNLAMALSEVLPCDLISVDSALIYRQMDIGTAKPSADELKKYPHALVDILDPIESYSAAQFRSDALALMAKSTAQGRIPLLVGGTMLYYKTLFEGIATMPETSLEVRAMLEQQLQEQGLAWLHAELEKVDADSAARININDTQRIIRALEIWHLSGKSMSWHLMQQKLEKQRQEQAGKRNLPYTVKTFAIAPLERSVLHERIAQRFQLMLQQGFIEEVQKLRARGDLHMGLPSMRAVGYRQVWEYLDGDCSFDEMQARGIAATRQLAKRQFTWLRSWSDAHWLDSLATDNLSTALKLLNNAPS
ncbi:tRNA (adenosine(37)-N6)-dimethylallyltransferase MiaA [Pseudomonas sp. F1_0610]|uniref:tRNA (adenosine(37)-N6)-dimethylallyltransferase MiaA n=1 Tax=Pseudomonas sp. F1_0610 TaxID=3114284 RepID=UPI0039C0AD0E